MLAAFTRRTSFLLILLMLVAATQLGWAHAILKDSTPKANSSVTGPDVGITVRFNVRIDGGRSRLHLIAPDGASLPLTIAKQDSPDTLQSQAKGLKPGAYKLIWNVLASDGHMSKGEIPFTVN